MLWKMRNVQLNKGVFFAPYGDSAPFFKLICHILTSIANQRPARAV